MYQEKNQKESLFTNNPNMITFECYEKIGAQMENCICQIDRGDAMGTACFCKIPFPDLEHTLPVLITNNHVIDEELLFKKNGKIRISIKKENNFKEIYLDGRKKMTFSENNLDITIIEIKEEDNIKNFLELDDKIINNIIKNDNINNKFDGESIYIIQYPNSKLSISFGKIKKIDKIKKYEIFHKCNTEKGSSGSPILRYNNKVIGIHKNGAGGKDPYNGGTLLNEPIKKFIEKYFKSSDKNKYSNVKIVTSIYNSPTFNINVIKTQKSYNLKSQTSNNVQDRDNSNFQKKDKNNFVNKNNSYINNKRPSTPIPTITKFYPKITKTNSHKNFPSNNGNKSKKKDKKQNSDLDTDNSNQKKIKESRKKYSSIIKNINKIYQETIYQKPMEFINSILNKYRYSIFVRSEDLLKNKSLKEIIDIISPKYNPDNYQGRDTIGIYEEIYYLLALIKDDIINGQIK